MTDSTRKILRGLSLAGFLLVGWLAIQFTHMSEMNVWAGSPSSHKSPAVRRCRAGQRGLQREGRVLLLPWH